MYYLGWLFFLLIFFLWRQDIRKVKETYRDILEQIRDERKELDTLREKYLNLIHNPPQNLK